MSVNLALKQMETAINSEYKDTARCNYHQRMYMKKLASDSMFDCYAKGINPSDIASMLASDITYVHIAAEKLDQAEYHTRPYVLNDREKLDIIETSSIFVNDVYEADLLCGHYTANHTFVNEMQEWLYCKPDAIIEDNLNRDNYIGVNIFTVNESDLDKDFKLPRYLRLYSEMSMAITGLKKWILVVKIQQECGRSYIHNFNFDVRPAHSLCLLDLAQRFWFGEVVSKVVSKVLGSWY